MRVIRRYSAGNRARITRGADIEACPIPASPHCFRAARHPLLQIHGYAVIGAVPVGRAPCGGVRGAAESFARQNDVEVRGAILLVGRIVA